MMSRIEYPREEISAWVQANWELLSAPEPDGMGWVFMSSCVKRYFANPTEYEEDQIAVDSFYARHKASEPRQTISEEYREMLDTILALHGAGKSPEQIRVALGLLPCALEGIRRVVGRGGDAPPPSPHPVPEIREFYRAGIRRA